MIFWQSQGGRRNPQASAATAGVAAFVWFANGTTVQPAGTTDTGGVSRYRLRKAALARQAEEEAQLVMAYDERDIGAIVHLLAASDLL